MRILIVTYEYSPRRSPRALRWAYLARELAFQGCEVHVLAPRLAGSSMEMPLGGSEVHRHQIFAGPLAGFAAWFSSRRERHGGRRPASSSRPQLSLNWKGRFFQVASRMWDVFLYPDSRAEWNPWALRAMTRLLKQVQPTLVITSHEPASVLYVGMAAKRRGYCWVADLGDPVCAPYTPRRWRRRAMRLERKVCEMADHVIVTQERAAHQLANRHGLPVDRCAVFPQGYDDRAEFTDDRTGQSEATSGLELLYTGRLYGYRWPEGLFEAISRVDGVRLTLVLPDASAEVNRLANDSGGQLRILGPLPHQEVIAMQRKADVLVNLGYQGLPVQVPAKVYEYLGSGRPVLHVSLDQDDPVVDFLKPLQRGWVCNDDASQLQGLLAQLVKRRRAGELDLGLKLEERDIEQFAFSRQGRRLAGLLEKVCVGTGQPAARCTATPIRKEGI